MPRRSRRQQPGTATKRATFHWEDDMITRRVALLLGTASLGFMGLLQGATAQQAAGPANMTFFVTSTGPGNGADLGGLEGADRQCQSLAQAAGAGSRTWRAYLSTQAAGTTPAVNARDRI